MQNTRKSIAVIRFSNSNKNKTNETNVSQEFNHGKHGKKRYGRELNIEFNKNKNNRNNSPDGPDVGVVRIQTRRKRQMWGELFIETIRNNWHSFRWSNWKSLDGQDEQNGMLRARMEVIGRGTRGKSAAICMLDV